MRGADKLQQEQKGRDPKWYSGKLAEKREAGAVPGRIRRIPISLKNESRTFLEERLGE